MGNLREEAKAFEPKKKGFQKGHPNYLTEESKRKMGLSRLGIKNHKWKGDKVGYRGLHLWIRRNKPKKENCEFCNKNPAKHIACIGEYSRDINQYKWSCPKCHVYIDGTINNLKSQ